MISVNQNGKNISLNGSLEVNGRKIFVLNELDEKSKLKLSINDGIKYISQLVDNDLIIEFTDKEGNIFELVLRNLSEILLNNNGEELVQILNSDTGEILSSITDLGTALVAAAAGDNNAQQVTQSDVKTNNINTNNDSLTQEVLNNLNTPELQNLDRFENLQIEPSLVSAPIIEILTTPNTEIDNDTIIQDNIIMEW